jgi:radical SAM superfamily enzyme YgiQ (UPF0313 family)
MKVALVSMPSQNYWHPAPSIVFLKGVLNRESIDSTCFDLNHAFLTEFGDNAIEWCESGSNYNPCYKTFIENYSKCFEGYEWIGASVFTFNSQIFTKLFLEVVREMYPKIKIVLGGAGMTSNHSNVNFITKDFGNEMIQKGFANYVLSGEGDRALPALLTGNDYFFPQMDDLSNMPIPDYSDINFSLYSKPTLIVTGSRGCVRQCTFCDVHANWKKYKYRPGTDVANEIIHQYYTYGVKHFHFSDSLVNGSLKEFRIFCKTLAEAKLPIEWRGQFIFRSGMTDEDWDNLAASGCKGLWIGIESGSDIVRWHMKKKFSNADMYKSIEALGKRKINMLYLLIVGYPTETEKDFNDTLELLRRSVAYKRYVEVRCNIAMLLPNTEIYDEFYLHHDDDHLWKTQTTDGVLTYKVRYERWKKVNTLVENLGLKSDKRIKQLEKAILRNIEKEDSKIILRSLEKEDSRVI